MIQFPEITDIEQVRFAIQGRDEFIEAEKHINGCKYHVFNYLLSYPDSFDDPIRRECRGLIFNRDGKLISRPFHKFHNIGEKDFTMMDKIDFTQAHRLLDKVDGSFIRPLIFGDDLYFATKMGVTDIAEKAFEFAMKEYPLMHEFCFGCDNFDYTPIFEYVGPHNRVVMEYPEGMVLLAIRENRSGKYLTYDEMEGIASDYNLPIVQESQLRLADLAQQKDTEGVVVTFENGFRCKAKTDWYVAIHKAKENILFEKNVIRLILEEKDDDIIPYLTAPDLERLTKFKDQLLNGIKFLTDTVMQWYSDIDVEQISRKEFAVKFSKHLGWLATIVFSCWDREHLVQGAVAANVRAAIIKLVLKHCGSQTDVDKIRNHLGIEKWTPTTTPMDA